jgi:hypothetical protein
MENLDLLFAKLRQPVHISYIARYIIKDSEEKTQEILDNLMEEGKIKESPLSKGYFQTT